MLLSNHRTYIKIMGKYFYFLFSSSIDVKMKLGKKIGGWLQDELHDCK